MPTRPTPSTIAPARYTLPAEPVKNGTRLTSTVSAA